MAIIQAALAFLFRSLGRYLNTAFGWATTLLFGKVPEKRQLFLSVIALGAVLWLVLVVGIIFPDVGAFLLAFVPVSDWIEPNVVRLIMLGLALILPAVIGFASLFLVDPAERPRGLAGKGGAVLKGYPYTIGLALTLLMMLVIAPFMKLRDLVKGWSSTHVPVVVDSRDYLDIVEQIKKVLDQGGIETSRERASILLRGPTKVFTFFAHDSVDDLVASELTVLKGEGLEVLLHPSDLVIRGKEEKTVRAHALLTEHLTFTKAHLTWSKEAQEFEDRLVKLWSDVHKDRAVVKNGAWSKLRSLERDLDRLKVSYEEWEVIFREKLLVERAMLKEAFSESPAT
jgi:hypothetical protein